jgi:hypothetical protein
VVTRLPQRVLDRLFDASLVTIMGLPPKDPNATMMARMKATKKMTTRKTKSLQSSENPTNADTACSCWWLPSMSTFGGKADMAISERDVCF